MLKIVVRDGDKVFTRGQDEPSSQSENSLKSIRLLLHSHASGPVSDDKLCDIMLTHLHIRISTSSATYCPMSANGKTKTWTPCLQVHLYPLDS